MDVIQFKLPNGFQPKLKVYRRRKIPRCVWVSPDTLFTLCEVLLRKLLLPGVPRRKFWATVINLLPRETARSTVWHQVQCPWEFNRHQHSIVNYANHWTLLSASVQQRNPAVSNIRIGSLVRNKITQLLLDLDYCSSSGSDGGMPHQHQQSIRFGTALQDPFEQAEEELTEQFVARSVAANMEASSAEVHPEGSRCNCCSNCGHRSDCKVALAPNCIPLLSKDQAVQQLIVMGQGTTRGSCHVQINESGPCECCQTRM
ncbi:uncharacterized protein LOC134208329 [Armigeres subalbatus]|uniref:uncharacterized protein LOC134208329 n=1 Tax=Armigeres subalbatus TaxID=124917 RepID=UPI002ED5A37D